MDNDCGSSNRNACTIPHSNTEPDDINCNKYTAANQRANRNASTVQQDGDPARHHRYRLADPQRGRGNGTAHHRDLA
ncbi:hypothetical protein GCM10007862_25060 [Dyella lipolytica]|nr:hypothetical protein GCM10007862_25060 [Dyella lipolytica]